jgi:UDP-glucuronate 4-epimerase
VPDTEADVSELIAVVDYRPKVGVEEGVREFVRWYRSYHSL